MGLALLALGGDAGAAAPTRDLKLEDYKYFRALSIDLQGRVPTRDELTAFEQADFDVDAWIDAHLQGDDYVERLTRIYGETQWTRGALHDWGLRNVYEIYPVWRHRYAPGVTHNTEHVFGLTVAAGTPVRLNPREHLRFGWWPWREAADRCFSPSNAEAILQLPRFLAQAGA